mmetsp:Transcript_10680/g.26986  ORF Transcript_10680/g.26986 Transcript_10680/m.26986 type:complete len:211 (-) Transcript_10680:647-1279(-)
MDPPHVQKGHAMLAAALVAVHVRVAAAQLHFQLIQSHVLHASERKVAAARRRGQLRVADVALPIGMEQMLLPLLVLDEIHDGLAVADSIGLTHVVVKHAIDEEEARGNVETLRSVDVVPHAIDAIPQNSQSLATQDQNLLHFPPHIVCAINRYAQHDVVRLYRLNEMTSFCLARARLAGLPLARDPLFRDRLRRAHRDVGWCMGLPQLCI